LVGELEETLEQIMLTAYFRIKSDQTQQMLHTSVPSEGAPMQKGWQPVVPKGGKRLANGNTTPTP